MDVIQGDLARARTAGSCNGANLVAAPTEGKKGNLIRVAVRHRLARNAIELQKKIYRHKMNPFTLSPPQGELKVISNEQRQLICPQVWEVPPPDEVKRLVHPVG